MTLIWRLRFLLAALALFVAPFCFAQNAYAGVLQVRDPSHLLSPDDVGRLRSTLSAAPFDARLIVTSEFSDAQDLSRFVGSLVVEPNMVAVGLDPQHRHVQVHFGTGTHIARSEWPGIERAGNDAFRRGDWEGGAASIFQTASAAVSAAGDPTGPQGPQGARRSLLGPGTILLFAIGAIGIGLYFASRRSTSAQAGPFGAPGQPYAGPPYGGGGYPPGGYPGYPPQSGLGPMGGGLIGAGLGGLAGYELGKLEGEREVREREPLRGGYGGGDDNDGPGGNYDEGGGGSSWDDPGDGGFDGGGGGDGGGSDF